MNIKLPPTKFPELLSLQKGNFVKIPKDLPELCHPQKSKSISIAKVTSNRFFTKSSPKFRKEQLKDALLVISMESVELRNETSTITLEEGTPMLVATDTGEELASKELWVELPDGKKGWVLRKSVALFSSEGYIEKFQRQSRDVWNGFIEPVGFIANNPLRVGGGLKASIVFWKNGLMQKKESLMELSVSGLQTLKASKSPLKPTSLSFSSDFYFRLGASGSFLLGPSFGYSFIKNSLYSQNQFMNAGLKGRIMINPWFGIYGELSAFGVSPLHSVYAVGGLSFAL